MQPLHIYSTGVQQSKMIPSSREDINSSNLKCQDNVSLKPDRTIKNKIKQWEKTWAKPNETKDI